MLIKPLKLGNLEIASNLIQAPLAGVSAAPFRELIHQFGGAGYCCTEMISAKTLAQQPPKRYVYKSPTEGLLCFQLSGNKPDELAKATEIAIGYGADLIDLNAGCPVDKIRKKGCGSKLLADSTHLAKLIRAIKTISPVPVSVKIRVDGISGERFNTDVTQAVTDAGVDCIIVHGRHWTEHYETEANLSEIASIVSATHLPVIGNGDVQDFASLAKMLKHTNCQGAMIGRASVGKPWLFQEIQAIAQGHVFISPSITAIGDLLLKHVDGLVKLEGEPLAILQARKLCKYYFCAANSFKEVPAAFYNIKNFNDLKNLIKIFFCTNT